MGRSGRVQSNKRKAVIERETRLKGMLRCYYCSVELFEHSVVGRATLDHKIPLCREGTWALSNLVLACVHCNHDKDKLTSIEYFRLRDKPQLMAQYKEYLHKQLNEKSPLQKEEALCTTDN